MIAEVVVNGTIAVVVLTLCAVAAVLIIIGRR